MFSNFVSNKWCLSSVDSFCFHNLHVAWFWQIYDVLFEYVTHSRSKNWCLFWMVFNFAFFALRIYSNLSKFNRLNDSIFCILHRRKVNTMKTSLLIYLVKCNTSLWERSIFIRKYIRQNLLSQDIVFRLFSSCNCK